MHPTPHTWKDARRLHAWHLKPRGWSQRQIAEALGVSEGAVSQWMTRARAAGPAALLREGIRPAGQWSHAFVQAQFVGVLINRRKRYDPPLRRVLADNQSLRDQADYRPALVSATQARRALDCTRLFVAAVRQRGGDAP